MNVVVVGDVVDGLVFHGPFDTSDEANEWAESEFRLEPWVVAPLEKPDIAPDEDVAKRVAGIRAPAVALDWDEDPGSL